MEVKVLKQAFKEIQKLPKEAHVDIYALFERLENGKRYRCPYRDRYPL